MAERRETAVSVRDLKRRRVLQACCGLALGGPAPWQLAALPLKLVDGAIVVAAPFEGRVGFQPPGLDPFGAAPPQ